MMLIHASDAKRTTFTIFKISCHIHSFFHEKAPKGKARWEEREKKRGNKI